MAALALHLGDMVGMRKFLDVGVAVVALQAAVDTGTELGTIDRNAVASGILHGLVAMAGQAIGLRGKSTGPKNDRHCDEAEGSPFAVSNGP